MAEARSLLSTTKIRPTAENNELLQQAGSAKLKTVATLSELLRRPELQWDSLAQLMPESPVLSGLSDTQKTELTTESRYAGYITREKLRIQRNQRAEGTPIPGDFDYAGVGALSSESIEALQRVRPETLGQASRVPGVPPAAVSALAIALEAAKRQQAHS